MYKKLLFAVLAATLILISGCANKGYFPPTANDVSRSVSKATTDPMTWAPLAGAGVVAAGGWDHQISDWARETTPVYGSTQNAVDASNRLRALARYGMIGSALLPHEPENGYWVPMLERQAVQHGAAYGSILARRAIKAQIDRPRPNGHVRSMPSGHATRTFATVASSRQNIEDADLAPWIKTSFVGSQIGLGAATSWARVEYGAHYPTDVLVGAALGNFVSVVINDLFLTGEDDHMTDEDGVRQSSTVDTDIIVGFGGNYEPSVGLSFQF